MTHENSWNALNESSFSSDDDQSSQSPKSPLQALNKISKCAQWIKVSDAPQTISQSQRATQFPEPTTISTRYKKQNSRAAHLKAYTNTQTKSNYVKKSYSQQSNTKILLQKASDTPKAGISHQPLATTSFTQEGMTSTNFQALPAIAKPSKSALGLQCFNFNDKNNPKQTRSEETSRTKDPFQDRLQQNEEKLDKIIEILKSLRNF